MNTGWQAVYTEPGPGPQPFLTESPDISVFHDTSCDCNKFIIYYASITRNTISMLMSADDNPLGTYTYMGELNGIQGYDPNLMYHPRGLFLLYSNFNQLNVVQLSGNQPWVVIRGPTTIAVPDQPWELLDGQLVEAPASIVIGGVANVVYSTNAYWLAGYTCGILRSPVTADPLDASAWIKSPVPVFTSNVINSAYGPGSGTFFTDGNNQLWWGYGAFNNPGGVPSNAAGRTIRMQLTGIAADGSVCLGTPGSYPSS
ncbi:hypothetical protein WJX72_002128 [[Myrmecia] bisecta]|uniref:Glycoside hydrolase family 43 protein n=1 Tax=[Myrmecia] bisecta TaxID=41462 RepID=A0AAW1PPW2_9CHLO